MAQSGILKISRPDGTVEEYPFTKADFFIGRNPTNDLVLNHEEVSRRHARMYFDGNDWLLENLSTANPIALEGQQVASPTRLVEGNRFDIGPFKVQFFSSQVKATPSSGRLQNSVSNPIGFSPTQPSALPSIPATPPQSRPFTLPTTTPEDASSRTILMGDYKPVLKVAIGYEIKEYKLEKPQINIGRAADNDIVIPLSTISRHHATLVKTPSGQYALRDNGSANGLTYKGSRVPEVNLADGDAVRIGDELGNFASLVYSDMLHPAIVQNQSLKIQPGQASVTIGRSADNNLILNYPLVSAHHASIHSDANGTFLQDLGSANGTFVRGMRLSPRTPIQIQPGELIQIANYRLVYQADQITHLENDKVRIDALNVGKKVEPGSTILLRNISLSIAPKEFVVIVGGSGAGKSTLMDALNGFRPASEGQVLLNGDDYYQNFSTYRSSLGYVPQDDILHRELSVERALYYTAKLRLPKDTKDAEISQRVNEVLEDVEMTARRKIAVARLSGGQRKRVSIAAELLAKPNLFYLDEPTSGLDAGLDKRMMYLLRRLADQGRTIVMVTHATGNIDVCDKVIFLGAGGRLCYYGPPHAALKFFEVTQFADIYSKLEQTPTSAEEWEARYRQSPYYAEYVGEPLQNIPQSSKTPAERAKIPQLSGWRQFGILTRRYAELMWRDRINLAVLVLQAPIIAVILALVAGGHIFEDGKTPGDAQKILFMMAVTAVWLGTNNAAREIAKEGPIYLRERLVNLRVLPYIMSKMVVLAILCLVQSLLLTGIVLAVTGMPPGGAFLPAAVELVIGVWLTTLVGTAIGLLISAIVDNSDKATSIVPIVLLPQIILAGISFSLSGPSQTLSYLTVSKWSVGSLGTSSSINRLYYQFDGAPPGLDPASKPYVGDYDPNNYDDNPSDKKSFSSDEFHNSQRTHLLGRWGILVGMLFIFLALAYFFQKRKDRAWRHK